MSRRKIGDVLWLALEYAKDDREGLIAAYSGDTREETVRKAIADVKAFNALQVRLFGTSRSKLRAMLDGMTPKSIFAILDEKLEVKD